MKAEDKLTPELQLGGNTQGTEGKLSLVSTDKKIVLENKNSLPFKRGRREPQALRRNSSVLKIAVIKNAMKGFEKGVDISKCYLYCLYDKYNKKLLL